MYSIRSNLRPLGAPRTSAVIGSAIKAQEPVAGPNLGAVVTNAHTDNKTP